MNTQRYRLPAHHPAICHSRSAQNVSRNVCPPRLSLSPSLSQRSIGATVSPPQGTWCCPWVCPAGRTHNLEWLIQSPREALATVSLLNPALPIDWPRPPIAQRMTGGGMDYCDAVVHCDHLPRTPTVQTFLTLYAHGTDDRRRRLALAEGQVLSGVPEYMGTPLY